MQTIIQEKITKADEDCAKRLHLKNIKVPVETFMNFKKKNSLGISIFGYENKKNILSYLFLKLF